MENSPFKISVNFKKTFFVTIIFIFSTFVFAQEELEEAKKIIDPNESVSFVTEDEKGNQIIKQKLVWAFDEYAFKFEVFVEKKNRKGEYQEILKKETNDNSLEVSLTPGFYRYKIVVYNLLRQIDDEGEWIEFEVIEARQPRISSMSPKQIYLEEEQDGIYSLGGRYLNEKSEYIFYTKNNRTIKAELVESNSGGSSIKIKVKLRDLQPGQYKLKITNRGGLYTEEDDIKIQFKKPMDFDVYLGYVCPINTYDETLKNYMNANVWPISAMVGCTFIPFKTAVGYFGVGIASSFTRMSAKLDSYTIDGNMITSYLNFVYQLPIIRGKLVLDTHIGAGLAMINNLAFNFGNGLRSNPALNSVAFSCDVGLGMQYYFTKRFYSEIRVGTSLSFFKDMMTNLVTPSVLAGWQF